MSGVQVGENHLGRAVFAARTYEAGDRIGTVRGRIIDDPEFTSNYSIDLGGTCSLDPRPPFRFLNHCCTPNCELVLMEHRRAARADVLDVVLFARKRIRLGDELTIDYAWPAEAAIPCGCGSRWCRGWVVARSQRKYVISPSISLPTPQELAPAFEAIAIP